MKKFLRTLLMLTCVFCLTACGSEETISEMQQSKIDVAKEKSLMVISMTSALVENGSVDEILNSYNNIELADVYASIFANNTGDTSFSCDGKSVRSALTSFESGLTTLGVIKDIGEASSIVDGETIIITVPVTGENANASIEVIFTNDIYLKMKSCTLNLNESMSELMARAGLNTLIGMGTVFAVLILISFIIAGFGLIPKIQAAFAKKEEVKEAQMNVPVQAEVTEEAEELADDMELVAVIAAAIAAYEGTSVDGFRVRSIKRAKTNKWQKA